MTGPRFLSDLNTRNASECWRNRRAARCFGNRLGVDFFRRQKRVWIDRQKAETLARNSMGISSVGGSQLERMKSAGVEIGEWAKNILVYVSRRKRVMSSGDLPAVLVDRRQKLRPSPRSDRQEVGILVFVQRLWKAELDGLKKHGYFEKFDMYT